MSKKILIIRTIKTELLISLINLLKKENKFEKIDLLTHPFQHSLIYVNKQINKIYLYNSSSDFAKKYIGRSMLTNLKKQNYNKIIIPQMFHGNAGFSDVIFLASEINAREIYFYSYDLNKLTKIEKSYYIIFFLNFIFSKILAVFLQSLFWFLFYLLFLLHFLKKKVKFIFKNFIS